MIFNANGYEVLQTCELENSKFSYDHLKRLHACNKRLKRYQIGTIKRSSWKQIETIQEPADQIMVKKHQIWPDILLWIFRICVLNCDKYYSWHNNMFTMNIFLFFFQEFHQKLTRPKFPSGITLKISTSNFSIDASTDLLRFPRDLSLCFF